MSVTYRCDVCSTEVEAVIDNAVAAAPDHWLEVEITVWGDDVETSTLHVCPTCSKRPTTKSAHGAIKYAALKLYGWAPP